MHPPRRLASLRARECGLLLRMRSQSWLTPLLIFLGCLLIPLGIIAAIAPSAGERDGSRAEGPLRIVVSVPPLAGLVGMVVPSDAEITTLVRPGVSAHGYRPAPSDAVALARADLVVLVGLGLDSAVERPADAAGVRTVRLADMLGMVGAAVDHAGHDHSDPAHEHTGTDAHLWLDPAIAAASLQPLADAVLLAVRSAGFDVDSAAALARVAEAGERVAELSGELDGMLAPLEGKRVVTVHSAFGRLFERYGIIEAGVIRPIAASDPTPGEIELASQAARSADGIFTEPQLESGFAERLADLTGTPLGSLDPLGSGDWFALLRQNAAELVRVLGAGDAEPAG